MFKFNPALLVWACQDITFQSDTISNKFLATIKQLKLKIILPDFLQGSNINDQQTFHPSATSGSTGQHGSIKQCTFRPFLDQHILRLPIKY
jgi:hypothetical protein